MRICFIHHPNDSYIRDRIEYFSDNGHDVISISIGKHKGINMPKNVKVISLNLNIIGFNLLKRFIFLELIKRVTCNYKVDILHIVNVFNGIYAKFSCSKKTVIQNIGSDVIKVPMKYPIVKIFYRYFYRHADAIIQDSIIAQDHGLNYGASTKFNHVIEYGVNFIKFNSRLQKGIARKYLNLNNKQKMVFSSRGGYKNSASWDETNSIYNLDIIIKSIPAVKKYFPDVCFVFSNSGNVSYQNDAEKLIHDLEIQNNILFTERLDHNNEIPSFTIDADLVISVPNTDSSPLSVYEAMACKTPVIISDLPWYKDKFESDSDVLVVPVRDVEKLSYAIIQILCGEKAVDVDSAYDKVFKNINYLIENKKLEMLYEQILS